jgi:hypothetical protein
MAESAEEARGRLARYRKGAAHAEALAAAANSPELHDAYLGVARTWSDLAEQLERELSAKEGR